MNILDKHENLYVSILDQKVNMIPVAGGEILIHIPIETLYYAENHRQYDPLKIHSKKKMVDYVIEWLTEFGGNCDTGSTEFEDFLDKMFDEALECGEEWLDMAEIEEWNE
jgi:hypothetical protein